MQKKLIPKFQNTPVIEVFMHELRGYLSEDNYELTIDETAQKEILEKLKANTNKAKFSLIIDGLTGAIKHSFGIEKWLGYPEKSFTTKKFLEVTHPTHAIAHWINGSTIWSVASKYKEFVNFYDISMIYTLGIKHNNGNFLFCSCENFFFQISSEGKGIEFAYEYTVLKDLDNEDFNVSFFDKSGSRYDILKIHATEKKQKFKAVKLFSTQEMRILKRYANRENTTAQSISESFKISKATVVTHNTNILEKAEIYFHKRFDSAKHFALYLKHLELI